MSFRRRSGTLALVVFLLAVAACSDGPGQTSGQTSPEREITLDLPTTPVKAEMPKLTCPDEAAVASIIGRPVTDTKTSDNELGLIECYYELDPKKLLFLAFRRDIARTGHPGRGATADDLGPGFVRFQNEEEHGAICEVFEPTFFDVVVYDFRESRQPDVLCGWATQLIKLPFHEPVPVELANPSKGRPGACDWLADTDLPVRVGPQTNFHPKAQETTMFGRPFVKAQGCQVSAGEVSVWWWVSEALPSNEIARAVEHYDSRGARRVDVGDAGFITYPVGIALVHGDHMIEVAIEPRETAGREDAELRLARAVIAAIS